MKPLIVLLIAFVISLSPMFSQDWSMFPLGQTSFFKVYNTNSYIESDFTIEKITNDTCVIDGDEFHYYFGTKQVDYLNCLFDEDFYIDFYNSNNESLIRPDSFVIKNDTMYFIKSGHIYPIPVNMMVGDTLILPGVEEYYLTCDSAYVDTFLNIIDSVKLVRFNYELSTITYKDDVLLLSKNYGIIKFWQIIDDIDLDSHYQEATLKGFYNQGEYAGINFNSFDDFFHLNIGDEVFWEYTLDDLTNWPEEICFSYRFKDVITDITDTQDSLIYHCTRYYVDSTLGIDIEFDKEIFQELINLPYRYGISNLDNVNIMVDLENANYARASNYGYLYSDSILKVTFTNSINWDIENCTLMELMGGSKVFSFDSKIGLCHSANYSFYTSHYGNVTGGVIDGVPFGDITPIGVELHDSSGKLMIYPNPFTDKTVISLDYNGNLISECDIYNISGQLVRQLPNINAKSFIIEKEELPNGYYIVKIKSQDRLFVNSIIIQN